ncbi:MAG TPA: class I SAM-dependent methyltransferase [Baekduia sp.]|uniref:class I SAM-dependent methyltransferase n=1 Tax=Baekduia sp. TaxID=2600305 RepID=UPI002BBC50DC|nr:class I SAM-dependent methyltransferase [Baekduia sp.]HMJ37598.1 class I SAM-dependent methyltransferase [Baekduia sp.]
MTASDPVDEPRDRDATRLAGESLAANDPTGWFERLYAAARTGDAIVPWDREAPHPLLIGWTQEHELEGAGRRAMVVGAGPGHDAEHVAGLGFATTAFDISETAVHAAQERHPDSRVEYVAADLLDLPAEWIGAFDLVVEIMTVQALPDPPRRAAIASVARLVAPGGTLLVVAAAHDGGAREGGPPWPLVREEVEAFAAGGALTTVAVEEHADPHRWRAAFRRPG